MAKMRQLTSMAYVPSLQQIKERTTSVKAWELPKQKSALAPDHVWTNEDMDPVTVENQTWTLWTWMAYWATDMINLSTWETASSIIAVGLTWRDAIPIMLVGTTCVAIPMVCPVRRPVPVARSSKYVETRGLQTVLMFILLLTFFSF